MKPFSIIILIYFVIFSNVSAQDEWSLERCIERAISENLNIKRQKLNKNLSEKNLKQSRFSLLPSLNTYVTQGYNFGRSVDPFTDAFTQQNVETGNMSIVTGITLFHGFQKINTIRKNKLDFQASRYDVVKAINDISLAVVNAFLQVLFSKELVEISEGQLTIINLQVDRIQNMVDVGKLAKGDLLEVEAQKIAEELQLINAQNQLDVTYLNIKQLLEINQNDTFHITFPNIIIEKDIDFATTDQIYQIASNSFPEIRSAELRLQSSKRSLAISKGGRSPELTMSSSINTGYSNSNAYLINMPHIPFQDQVEDNLNKSVNFSLNIPIFNGWHTNTAISQSKISVLDASYSLLQKKNELRKQIEQARADVLAAKKQYEYANKTVEVFEETFRYTQEKYNLGIINTYEYNDSKNKLNKAESDLIQAKYDYLFKIKIIDFYMGETLNL